MERSFERVWRCQSSSGVQFYWACLLWSATHLLRADICSVCSLYLHVMVFLKLQLHTTDLLVKLSATSNRLLQNNWRDLCTMWTPNLSFWWMLLQFLINKANQQAGWRGTQSKQLSWNFMHLHLEQSSPVSLSKTCVNPSSSRLQAKMPAWAPNF